MIDIEAVQEGLAAAVAPVAGIRQALPALLDAINPPTWGCSEVEIDYDKTFGGAAGGLNEGVFSCGLFTSRGDDRSGIKLLNGFLVAGTIKAAVEVDRTLGGACKTLIVERVKGAYRLYQIGGTDYLGAIFDVRVWS